MCGIFISASVDDPLHPSDLDLKRLESRGPDGLTMLNHAYQTRLEREESRTIHITQIASVLGLRGPKIVKQPSESNDQRLALCWNGEAWTLDGEPVTANDTTVILELLGSALKEHDSGLEGPKEALGRVVRALARVDGPYAFALFDRWSQRIFFGRDFLGRRSLGLKVYANGSLVISSTSTGSSWAEVRADGVYCVELSHSQGADGIDMPSILNDSKISTVHHLPYRFADGLSDSRSVCPGEELILRHSTHVEVGDSPSISQQICPQCNRRFGSFPLGSLPT